ncbi:MAG: hypothetical protein AXA67_10685 [Methylothermaceae bacteria B42]|nr:MAG: hypothetical protein AXA67_10685 [Methylothermaceae bacteria B42]HHJ38944.1 hypothetical protein [Methylothermaceae bacterium]
MMNTASGNELSKTEYPPRQFPLKEVRITVLHQTGHGIPGSYRITITGDGKAVQAVDKNKRKEITLSKKQLVELINEFYRIHFFELPDSYGVQRHVVLMDDGTLRLFTGRLADVASQQVCIEISDYKKCITVINRHPLELRLLVDKMEALFK